MAANKVTFTTTYEGLRGLAGTHEVFASFGEARGIPLLHYLPQNLYAWGDRSNGSRTLAYAILLHAAGLDTASRLCNAFLDEVISALPPLSWKLTNDQVRTWIVAHTQPASCTALESTSLSACEP